MIVKPKLPLNIPVTAEEQARLRVQRLLPCIMLNLMTPALEKAGYAFKRSDVLTFVERSIRECLVGMTPLEQVSAAMKASDEATAILRASNADSVVLLWRAVARLIIALHERKEDITPDLGLAAFAIDSDWQCDDPSAYERMLVNDLTDKLHNEARKRGWWWSV